MCSSPAWLARPGRRGALDQFPSERLGARGTRLEDEPRRDATLFDDRLGDGGQRRVGGRGVGGVVEADHREIGRASCRERGEISGGAVSLKKKKKNKRER